MADNCLFCKIAAGDIPCKKVYEDDRILAFHDIAPQAPVHVLVIPKHHFNSLDNITENDREAAGHLLERGAHGARLLEVNQEGYRTIIKTNADGGQEVFHIHAHILGGQRIGPMVAR